MKSSTITSAFRTIVLSVIACTAFHLLFGEEMDKTVGAFLFRFIIDKGIAVGLFYLTHILFERWKDDPFLSLIKEPNT